MKTEATAISDLGIRSQPYYLRLKHNIYCFLETNAIHSKITHRFHLFMISLIVLNVLAVILETVSYMESQYSNVFDVFEIFSVAIFTLEYILRIWVCTENVNYSGSIIGRIRFILTPLSLVDLVSILPIYLPVLIPFDLRFMRIIRLFRIFRLFKLGRYSTAYQLMVRVVRQKAEYLSLSLFFVVSALVIASSFMYFIEHDAQPETFSSIPATMWWGIVTLTTVGYGDAYPITPIGKILSGLLSLMGIGLFALPAGILASGFSDEMHKKCAPKEYCPHCGKELNKNNNDRL